MSKTNCPDLEKMVEELEKSTVLEKIEKKLQEIGEILLTKYIIQVDNVTIQPLWVEAYYYNTKHFNDPFVHKANEQLKNNVLYFHHKTDDQRNGVDICLSSGNCYLSYLLKYTLIDGFVKTQSELSPLIRNEYNNSIKKDPNIGVLKLRENPTNVISFTNRIGLTSDEEQDAEKKQLKNHYKNLKLSIVRDFDKHFIANFKFPKREELVKNYLSIKTEWSKAEKADFCKKVLDYCLNEYKD